MIRAEEEYKEEKNTLRRAKRGEKLNSKPVKLGNVYANGYSTSRCGRPLNQSLKSDPLYWAEYKRGHVDGKKNVVSSKETPSYFRGKANGTAWARSRMETNDFSEMEFQSLLTERLTQAKSPIDVNDWLAYERGFIKGSMTYFTNGKANKHQHKKRERAPTVIENEDQQNIKRARKSDYDSTFFAVVVTEFPLSQEIPAPGVKLKK